MNFPIGGKRIDPSVNVTLMLLHNRKNLQLEQLENRKGAFEFSLWKERERERERILKVWQYFSLKKVEFTFSEKICD